MTETKYGGICPHCGEFVEQSGNSLKASDKLEHLDNCDDFVNYPFLAAKKEDGEVERI